MKRLLATFIIFCGVIFLPYWVYLPAMFLGMIIFPFYWEAILLAFLIEVLYGPGTVRIFSPIVLSALVLTALLLPVREKMRFNL